MWNYEKRLEYPINIKRTDAAMAKAIISQFGGPDGETGAAMRYLSQRFAMPYRPVMGILTDIGTEASKYEFVDLVQTKKEILAYPICSIAAVFKMLVRILNTLRSHIWDMPVFLFSDYTKSTVGENGDCPEVYGFHWNENLQMVISSYGIIRILIVKEIGAIGRIWLSLLFSYDETVL